LKRRHYCITECIYFAQSFGLCAVTQISKAEAYSQADALVAILSDSDKVYQAKHGDDAAALENFKAQAGQMAAQIKQLADQADAQRQAQAAAATAATQTTTTAQTSSGLVIDTTTLLMLGGGALVLILLLR